ncbi:FprA family A-type flavoprotein [Floccifex sp.]|uniref:FprA family A-type flavoprotein n=1 Tax=Floccifex sp. TaxID=2815810 RepID=UPI002A74C33D|nr:flavodoxin domain-containing protein [Floccifex sp.]MDD7281433.1 flavodoxin domain-containing protein [Erysipelotrichaceae bacterium]MDY2957813.1 flavodoxin domain-containing protein [Floccifex sp.]
MKVTNDIKYVGVNDHEIDLFEGQFQLERGMAYNSYVILDDKIAIMDSVDAHFGQVWLNNIKTVLNGKTPDYLVVHHMEPDHSANITLLANEYPDMTIVSSMQAFTMMKQFYGSDYQDRRLIVKEGSTLELGKHTLSFIGAPMVHWPEVLMSYDACDKVLFSADGFGKFGANDIEDPEGWACEARRYYFGIVGKYGVQTQNVLKKASNLDIQIICPLHGPVLDENLGYYLDLYNTWSSYQTESEGILIAYSSVYGNTKNACLELKKVLEEKGCQKVVLADLAREDMHECIEDAFRYGKIVLASITYNATIFPHMNTFIENLVERNFQNKTIGFMENGSWAPMANKVMLKKLENCKNITFTENNVSIRGAMNDASKAQIKALADELMK